MCRYIRVAFLAGCIANVTFVRLNEATVRVLQRNGCEVVIPGSQNCCGALHVHSGLKDQARALARNNIDAVLGEDFDAVITNAAGCGSTLKEYDDLLENDSVYLEKAIKFKSLMKDVTEFLAGIELNPGMKPVNVVATYQDSCHLAHGQKIKAAPRKLLNSIPGLMFREMPMADLCCGSAGVYNLEHPDLSDRILTPKIEDIVTSGAELVISANPGCILQIEKGLREAGVSIPVRHIATALDEALGGEAS